MKNGFLFTWARVIGFAGVLIVGTVADFPVISTAVPSAGVDGSSNVVASAGPAGSSASLQPKDDRTTKPTGEPANSERAVAPLPPAFVVLVSAVVGIVALGSRRRRKKGNVILGPESRFADRPAELSLRSVIATAQTNVRAVVANDDGYYLHRASRRQ